MDQKSDHQVSFLVKGIVNRKLRGPLFLEGIRRIVIQWKILVNKGFMPNGR